MLVVFQFFLMLCSLKHFHPKSDQETQNAAIYYSGWNAAVAFLAIDRCILAISEHCS
jgi:hypothetical protein